jgi:phosphate transport system substrate-binding protein
MNIRSRRAVLSTVVATMAIGVAGVAVASGATITGAGSTLAAPVYMQWGSNLKDKLTLNYGAVGSGAGIAAFAAGTAQFAATDPPVKPQDQMTFKKGKALSIPTVLGAITVSYNIQGIHSGMKLDGATIADIYLGKVKNWNDPEITKLNPKMKLPKAAIQVVHRSDSSGTTAGFTTFLAAYSPTWKSKIGADKVVQWPVGTGAKGNAGVAGAVKQAQNSIGYVEQSYALANHFTYASVKNSHGTFEAPNLASTSAAAQGILIPPSLRFIAINSRNKNAYPIVSQTFVVAYQDLCAGGMSADEAKAFGTFISYGLNAGQKVAQQLSYAPLPPGLLAKSKALARTFNCGGHPVGA